MKLFVFSVYDTAVKAFMPPFYVRSDGEAIRSFTEAVNDAKHPFAKNWSDYTLFKLGSFDDLNGVFEGIEPLRMLSALEAGIPRDPEAGNN